MTPAEALQRYFHHPSFREGQEDIVRRIAAGEELCVVMPTGGGKSLCYQLPVLMRDGYGLVLSPLIALMKDQVDALNARGIPARCVNSSLSQEEQSAAFEDIASGTAKFLYVAPERFRSEGFLAFLSQHRPSLVVVDEAHCISQWGFDFRPDYQRLWQTVPLLAELQVCAFTATATPHVRDDIRKQMGRPSMEDVVTGFRRPNLHFSVLHCARKNEAHDLLDSLLQDDVPTIVYASTRKNVEEIADDFGIPKYHAGMSDDDRRRAQNKFLSDPCPVLVATNAFGMGIDRPDVRRVIHYNIPGSLEAYYQEAGRAGRDGKPAECILIQSYADLRIQRYLLEMNNPEMHLLRGVHAYLLAHRQPDDTAIWDADRAHAAMGLGTSKSIGHLNAALRILERYGLLMRNFERGLAEAISLSLRKPVATVLRENAEPKTQRSLFLQRLASHFAASGRAEYHGGTADLGLLLGFPGTLVPKLLDALKESELVYGGTELGERVTLLPPGLQGRFPITEAALARKRQMDEQRLDDVVSYGYCHGCRQAHIVRFFGERIGSWRCGTCDHCSHGAERRRSYGY